MAQVLTSVRSRHRAFRTSSRRHALDAGMDRELRRADDLRLDGDVVADDVEHRRARRARLEVLALACRSAATCAQVVSITPGAYPTRPAEVVTYTRCLVVAPSARRLRPARSTTCPGYTLPGATPCPGYDPACSDPYRAATLCCATTLPGLRPARPTTLSGVRPARATTPSRTVCGVTRQVRGARRTIVLLAQWPRMPLINDPPSYSGRSDNARACGVRPSIVLCRVPLRTLCCRGGSRRRTPGRDPRRVAHHDHRS